jgi:hypothetical protein
MNLHTRDAPRYVETEQSSEKDGLPRFRVFDRSRADWIAYCEGKDDCAAIVTALNYLHHGGR